MKNYLVILASVFQISIVHANEYTTVPAASLAAQMQAASLSLLNSLAPKKQKQASFDLDSKQKKEWRYFPSPSFFAGLVLPEHHGLRITELSEAQRAQLLKLLNLGLSDKGMAAVTAALELEKKTGPDYRSLLNRILFKYGPENYFVSFFGKPTDVKWGWRFEGHHLSFTFMIDHEMQQVIASPVFVGTTEAQVIVDSKEVRVLEGSVKAAQSLVLSLNGEQLNLARQSQTKVPKFSLFAPSLLGGPLKLKQPLSKGLSWGKMSEEQHAYMLSILIDYQEQLAPSARAKDVTGLDASDLESLEFVWFGDAQMKEPFYFRVQSKRFVLEVTCSEGSAEHYHSSWINL